MTAIQDRYGIRAALIIERLRAHALGEIDLSPTQIRVAEILLRKVIPGFRAGWVLNCGRHRICNGLGIMRACLETQKLEQLEARMDKIADRVARDRTNAAREDQHP
jgi:hypothetical protein